MSNRFSTFTATFAIGTEVAAGRAVDALTEMFSETGIAVAAFERPGGAWDVTLYFPEAPDAGIITQAIRDVAHEAADTLVFANTEAMDWVKASLDELRPVAAGRFVVHGAHDRARIAPNKIAIEIEAGLAFGTGHHGTTRGCLLLFDEVLRGRAVRHILDVGTGSGVLAIAAAKAVRRPVLATDIDAQSVIVARENAHLNRAGQLVSVVHAAGFAAEEFTAFGPFDLVFANILANPLKALAQPMSRHVTRSGLAILSGLLPSQAAGVIAAYRGAGFVLLRHLRLDGWSSLLLTRR